MHDLNVTLVQTTLHWQDINANLAMLEDKLTRLTDAGDLIILPEMFSTGFSMQPEVHAEPMTGKAVTWLKRMSGEMSVDIAGSLMIADQGNFYNRLVWARPDGRLFTYDKKHLFAYAGEDKVYTAGRGHLTVELKGWRIRPFICYDLRFPIWCRNLNEVYDLAIFTANWPAIRSPHWRALLRTRAIENQSFVIGVNRTGQDGSGLDYSGDSSLIDPQGNILFEVREKEDCRTLILKKQKLNDCRARFPFLKDADADLVNNEADH